jgi:hypothetical protein
MSLEILDLLTVSNGWGSLKNLTGLLQMGADR